MTADAETRRVAVRDRLRARLVHPGPAWKRTATLQAAIGSLGSQTGVPWSFEDGNAQDVVLRTADGSVHGSPTPWHHSDLVEAALAQFREVHGQPENVSGST